MTDVLPRGTSVEWGRWQQQSTRAGVADQIRTAIVQSCRPWNDLARIGAMRPWSGAFLMSINNRSW